MTCTTRQLSRLADICLQILLELFQCPHFASKAINIFLVEVQKYFLVNPNFFASGVISKYYADLNTERNRSFEIGTNEGESMLSDD